MSALRSACSALLVALAGGCANPPPPPTSQELSVVAIRVATRPPIPLTTQANERIYFVRIQDETTLASSMPMRSNYFDGKYAFLLNAKPGRYAAVASTIVRENESNISQPVHKGRRVTVSVGFTVRSETGFTAYFPEEVIRSTLVDARAGTIAFMGEFVLDTSPGLANADKAQLYYRDYISPSDEDLIEMTGLFDVNFIYRGELHSAEQGPETNRRFLDATRERLIAGGWESFLLEPVSSPGPE
jgi:hypothetical protein